MSTVENPLKDQLYKKYKAAMVYIEVKNADGDRSIGTGFHLDEGVIITAKHVVENEKIISMGTTERDFEFSQDDLNSYNSISQRFTGAWPQELSIKSGPHYPDDENIDLAVIVVNEIDFPFIPLGGHLDDWISDEDFILAKVIIMGYPPIPGSKKPLLVTATAEINAVADLYYAPHPHFIISSMPRGGFSGGVCLIEWKFSLGIIVSALSKDYAPTELGFMAVLSVEPIWTFLQKLKLLPTVQKEGWEGFWDSEIDNTIDANESDNTPL